MARRGVHKFHYGKKYVMERFYPPELFHPKSFRTIESGGYKFTVGVPIKSLKDGLFADGRFSAGTRVQRKLYPVGKFKKKYPKLFKKLEESPTKTATGQATSIPKYGLVAG